ncbi:PAS domain-containing sensor histidine kinase [Sphingomicrobium sediminis]|uniref:histidine kinase n=1 Tax=Sphingomicrobium sediminis TaxID=2950949 RepID=A0A9X2EH79_9SPHN|nr:PAS domain-containing sensor histidine kinase [Sphingomicrobium sediminis]MCM8557983.1 PAS domain S-box protein [Sphingomicrobium sediminis]
MAGDAPFLGGAFEATFDCIVVARPDGRIVYVNPAAEKSFGHPLRAAFGKTVAELLVPEDQTDLYQSEWDKFWNDEPTQIAGRGARTDIAHADGHRVPVHSSLRRIDIEGEAYAIIALRDLSEIDRLEGDARRNRKLFEQFTRNAPVGMYVKKGDGRYALINPQMERLFGKPAEEIIGKTVRDMLPPAEAQMVEDYDREILEAQAPKAVVEKLDDVGQYEWTLVVRFPLDSEDDPGAIGGFEIDITPQKRAEEELSRSRERLNQAERMTALGSLLAGVSHELNNPLAIVVGEATLLEEDAAGGTLEEGANRIRRAAERCASIVQSFLAMARQKPADRDQVDINALIEAVLSLTHYQMRSSDIRIDLDLAEDLPRIHADADQLQQVLINLLINAQQALQECAPPREIRVSSEREGDEIVIGVADNGPGIPAETAARIFDPFFTTKPEGTGTGIGLSYSQGVVEAHAGSLTLRDNGKGAHFDVRLPIDPGPARPMLEPIQENEA